MVVAGDEMSQFLHAGHREITESVVSDVQNLQMIQTSWDGADLVVVRHLVLQGKKANCEHLDLYSLFCPSVMKLHDFVKDVKIP